VTCKTSICRCYLSLASWGEPRWNPCHSLIFDYLSISIEGKKANLGYPGKPWVEIYSLMGNGHETDTCVCDCKCRHMKGPLDNDFIGSLQGNVTYHMGPGYHSPQGQWFVSFPYCKTLYLQDNQTEVINIHYKIK
jgi:hypothetical protein